MKSASLFRSVLFFGGKHCKNWVWLLAAVNLFGQTGRVTGVVRLEGVPRASVTVTVSRTTGGAGAVSSVRSGANGSYSVTGLAAGRYVVCTPNPGGDLVDACQWSARAPVVVDVTSGTTSTADVTLLAGSRISVLLRDPFNVLRKDPLGWRAPVVDVTVRTSLGVSLPASVKRRQDGLAEYELLIPRGTGYRLQVGSQDVALRAATGTTLPRGGGTELFDLATARQFTFDVTGLR